jgi:hypothetical protein
MPKHGVYQREVTREEREAKNQLHPVWRGVGFALLILIPIMSYAAMTVLWGQNQSAQWMPLPIDLVAKPGHFLYFGDPWIYVKIIITVTIMLIMYAILTLFTFVINSIFAPPRYGPFDVPPIRAKVNKRAR